MDNLSILQYQDETESCTTLASNTVAVILPAQVMAGCCTSALLVVLLHAACVSCGEVNYGDVIQSTGYMGHYFRRLYRRQRHCDEPGLAERVAIADLVLTGTIRALEPDPRGQPGSDVARVEVKRVFKDYHQVCSATAASLYNQ